LLFSGRSAVENLTTDESSDTDIVAPFPRQPEQGDTTYDVEN
jgi:hypothetical protein